MKINSSKEELLKMLLSTIKPQNNILLEKYYNESIIIDPENIETTTRRDLYFYIKSNNELERINKLFINLAIILDKFTRYVIWEDPSLIHHLHCSRLDLEGIKRRNIETLTSYGRIDGVKIDGGYKTFEINTKRPQMFEDSDWTSRYLKNLYSLDNLQQENNSLSIAEVIRDTYSINTKDKTPENIIFLPRVLRDEYDFSLYSGLKNVFPTSQIILCKLNELFDNLVIKDNTLQFKNQKVDLIIFVGSGVDELTLPSNNTLDIIPDEEINIRESIYSPRGRIINRALREAYNKGYVELFTSPATRISGTKHTYPLLQDMSILKKLKLSSEEMDSIELLTKTINNKNISIDSLDKNKLAIKSGDGMGKGIILGNGLTQKEWENKLSFLIKNKKKFLLQERIEFTLDEIFDVKNNTLEQAYLTFEPLFIMNPLKRDKTFISGYSSRAILKKDFSEHMRFNPEQGKEYILFGSVLETLN